MNSQNHTNWVNLEITQSGNKKVLIYNIKKKKEKETRTSTAPTTTLLPPNVGGIDTLGAWVGGEPMDRS